MTASLVTKKRNSDEVYNSFLELESNLDSLIMTTSREDVQKHATSAIERDVPYSMNTTQEQLPQTFHLLEKAVVRLTIANRLSIQHHRGRAGGSSSWQLDSKKVKGPLEQLIRQIGNVHHVITVMGPLPGIYALSEVADTWREKENKKLTTWNFPSDKKVTDFSLHDDRFEKHRDLIDESFGNMSEMLYHSMLDMGVAVLIGLFQIREEEARMELQNEMQSATTSDRPKSVRSVQLALRRLRSKLDLQPLEKLIQDPSPSEECLNSPADSASSVFLSHRMQQLLKVLMVEKSRIPPEERSKWRGMIFVQQTLMAIILEHVLSINPQLSFFKCQSLTGHNGAILAASMEDHHQRKIVEMFRTGRVNLLICTSVAEEGLDITHCSMVIRFDLPVTEASYIQSRGRARKPGSSYVMFINADDTTEKTMIVNLRFAEQCMKQFAMYRQNRDDMDDDEDVLGGTYEAYLEIAEAETQAILPKVDESNEVAQRTAPEMIAKYVQQLPQDEYCQLQPHLIFRSRDQQGRTEFQYQLTLPVNAAVNKAILGEWCGSKQKAKQSACYAACCELRKLGELNTSFFPISHRERAEPRRRTFKSFGSQLKVETAINPDNLSVQHAEWKSVAERSAEAPPTNGLVLHLQVVRSTPEMETPSSSSHPGFASLDFSPPPCMICSVPESLLFGILSLKKLDNLMRFPLYPETGNIMVDFLDAGSKVVSKKQLQTLKHYHFAVEESLYFKAKLFTAVCRQKSDIIEALVDEDVDLLPEYLKSSQEDQPVLNKSWYLVCPVKLSTGDTSNEEPDPLYQNSSMDNDVDEVMDTTESEECSDYRIDWEMVEQVSQRIKHLDKPGLTK